METALNEPQFDLEAIVASYPSNRGSLIPILQDIQENLGYLPESAVNDLAKLIDISPSEIYGVATFYTQFRFHPPGRHHVQVCQGTACHVRGAQQVLDSFEKRLGVKAGETTEDGAFDLERVACLGCCALAPVVSIDSKVHAEVTPKRVNGIVRQYEKQ